MSKKELVYDGNEKKVYATEDPDIVLIHYTDVATAFNGIKRAVLKGKGISNNYISAKVFEALAKAGVPNHFISLENDREQLCRRIEMIPLQVIVRNRLAGTTANMLGLENGTEIPNTVFELRYNCEALGDPMINDHHAVALGIASYAELGEIYDLARKADEVLVKFFHSAGIELIDFKMEVGRNPEGDIVIADEISPDNSRLWDEETGEVLDKDRFRHDMSDVCVSYRKVKDRLLKVSEQ